MRAIPDLFFVPYADLRLRWRDAVSGVAKPGRGAPVEFVIGVLETQLVRANAAIKANEDKAALVIPAIGVIVGVTGAKLTTARLDNAGLNLLITAIVVLGVLAVASAILCLSPASRSNGPEPSLAMAGVHDTPAEARFHYLDALGFAVYSTQQVGNRKAHYLNWSLRCLGLAVLLTVVLAGFGGFQAPSLEAAK